ncbi:hypothetical protein V496_08611 [Pseudogymnoascus sp. VKM F-4515 (FW-2607)]|nr:hypothetical protein V496_08611 [Pseudogymnoascus sp. VKM F-4515 (FW-2607)]
MNIRNRYFQYRPCRAWWSITDDGEESNSLLPRDEKRELRSREKPSSLSPPKTKKESRVKSRSEKIYTNIELLEQISDSTRRAVAAEERTLPFVKRSVAAQERTARLYELIAARGERAHEGKLAGAGCGRGHQAKDDAWLPPPPREKEKNPTLKELHKQMAHNTNHTAVAKERTAVLMERRAVAAERTVELLELIVARGEEVGLLGDILGSSDELGRD